MKKTIKQTISRWMVPVGALLMVGVTAPKPAQAGTLDDIAAILKAIGQAQSQANSHGYVAHDYESDEMEPFVYEDPSEYANDTIEQIAERHARERAHEARTGYKSPYPDLPYVYTPPSWGSMTSPYYNYP